MENRKSILRNGMIITSDTLSTIVPVNDSFILTIYVDCVPVFEKEYKTRKAAYMVETKMNRKYHNL
jgi:hypothetical protein